MKKTNQQLEMIEHKAMIEIMKCASLLILVIALGSMEHERIALFLLILYCSFKGFVYPLFRILRCEKRRRINNV